MNIMKILSVSAKVTYFVLCNTLANNGHLHLIQCYLSYLPFMMVNASEKVKYCRTPCITVCFAANHSQLNGPLKIWGTAINSVHTGWTMNKKISKCFLARPFSIKTLVHLLILSCSKYNNKFEVSQSQMFGLKKIAARHQGDLNNWEPWRFLSFQLKFLIPQNNPQLHSRYW